MASPVKHGRTETDVAVAIPKTFLALGPAEQSVAAPSPFPPIADFAFQSDCHTGALVAPDGAIDWLRVPRV
jgi:hypothetical protein